MNNLIILGNGFDLSNGLKTGYSDFKYFVEENVERFLPLNECDDFIDGEDLSGFLQYFELTEFFTHPDGGFALNEKSKYLICYYIISNAENSYNFKHQNRSIKWSDFENLLAHLPNDTDDLGYERWEAGMEDGGNPWAESAKAEDSASMYLEVFYESVKSCFSEWINSINVEVSKGALKRYEWINSKNINSYFITFNYTESLEINYFKEASDTPRILHIHGTSYNPKFGHSEKYAKDDEGMPTDVRYHLQSPLFEVFKKDIQSNIKFHEDKGDFPDSNTLESIYIWGWGVDNENFVDMEYLKYFLEKSGNITTLYLDGHYEDKIDSISKFISEISDNLLNIEIF